MPVVYIVLIFFFFYFAYPESVKVALTYIRTEESHSLLPENLIKVL